MKNTHIDENHKQLGRMSACRQFTAACLLAFLSLNPLCYAEEFRIAPKPDPAFPNGKFAAVQGNAGSAGEKFILENLSILQPVEITLLSKEPDAELSLQLSKFDWKTAERSGSTKGTGSQTFRIRTEGDLKILVASPQGEKPYQLAVWVGDEIQPPMKPAFVPKADFKNTKSTSSGPGIDLGSPVLWIIAFLLAAILVVLMVFLIRGKKS